MIIYLSNYLIVKKQEDIKEEFIVTNLQALENLKESAKEQNKELMSTIEEIHHQRLDLIENKLNEYTQRKAEYIQSKYPRRVESKKQIPVDNNRSNESSPIDYNNDILFTIAKSNAKFTNLANTYRFTIYRAKPEVHQSTKKRDTSISRPNNNIHQNQGIKNDSIGTTTKSRITKEREAQYGAYTKARTERNRIYQAITADAESLRVKLGEYSEQQHKNKQSIFKKIGVLGRIIAKLTSELKSKIENMTRKEPIKVEKLDLLNETVNEFNKKRRR